VVYNPGAQEYLIAPTSTTTQSGNYQVNFQPVIVGDVRAGAPNATTSGWIANWLYSGQASEGEIATSVAVTTAGSGYTNGTYTITTTGGGFTRQPVVSVTVSGTDITAASIIDPGIGGTSAPTVPLTSLGSGTLGVVTVTVAAATPGAEVATGTVLAAEKIQFGALISNL
jgi:hypothetical protein